MLATRNIPLFIAFRVLFNARFYYPVYGILFLDFGITLAELAVLNGVWAAAIVMLEVPSGALADRFGRRRLVIAAAGFMLLEMLLLMCAPLGGGAVLFTFLLINRVLSGAAEAAASGADEALAYDSLVQDGRESEWPAVLARLMRWQSAAFVVAMAAGAAVYDPNLVGTAASWIGLGEGEWTREHTLRLPVALTLVSALLIVPVALSMREPHVHKPTPGTDAPTTETCSTWGQILQTGRWILGQRIVLLIILASMCGDSVIRVFLTIASNYYRAIAIPEWTYGLLGAGMAVLGFATAAIGKWTTEHWKAPTNFIATGALLFTGLSGAVLAVPLWGALVLLPMGMGMFLLQFYVAHYVNEIAESHRRATVLSFKSLAMNLAYGSLTLLYAVLAWGIREQSAADISANAVLIATLPWLLGWFVVSAIALALYASFATRLRQQS